jgi:hypothetical protein
VTFGTLTTRVHGEDQQYNRSYIEYTGYDIVYIAYVINILSNCYSTLDSAGVAIWEPHAAPNEPFKRGVKSYAAGRSPMFMNHQALPNALYAVKLGRCPSARQAHDIEFPYDRIENQHAGDACPQQNSAFALRGRCYSLN